MSAWVQSPPTRSSAEALAARPSGSDASFSLGNGSSSGNHAFLLGAVAPGDEVVVGRDLHKSPGGRAHPDRRPAGLRGPAAALPLAVGVGIQPDDVAAALDTHPAARLVAVTSPN